MSMYASGAFNVREGREAHDERVEAALLPPRVAKGGIGNEKREIPKTVKRSAEEIVVQRRVP
jgi:hypothetical protein